MTGVLAPRSQRSGRREPVVVESFHRGLDVFRPVAALYAAWLAWQRHEEMTRPWVAAAVLGAMLLWSVALLFYRRRTLSTVMVEGAIAVLGILATLLVEQPEAIAAGQLTIPTIWAAGPVAGAAVVAGARGGLVAAGAVAIADVVAVSGRPTEGTVHNIVLLVLLGGLVGLAVDLARTGLAREEVVLLERERLAERERIARVVHDGVLQALAYIHRRGAELGPDGEELASLAADQERTLRRFVSGTGAPAVGPTDLRGDPDVDTDVDLRLEVTATERPGVTVAVPAGPVLVDRVVARELGAALRAVLDNVAQHAGPGARAWVLLEGDPSGVDLTVRDDGVGGELDEVLAAGDRGRMGVRSSIRGRVEDLGGTATWQTRPGAGCTVRITVPRRVEEHR